MITLLISSLKISVSPRSSATYPGFGLGMGRKGKALSYNVIVLTSSSYERSQYSPHNQCTAKILMLFTLSFLLEGDWRGEGGLGR